jgi:hypothetical protein
MRLGDRKSKRGCGFSRNILRGIADDAGGVHLPGIAARMIAFVRASDPKVNPLLVSNPMLLLSAGAARQVRTMC